MDDNEDNRKIKCMVYQILTVRYKETIAKNEEKSLSELKEKVAPYSDDMNVLSSNILDDAKTEDGKFTKIIQYLRGISVVDLAIPFYLSIKEMNAYKFATPTDKAILGTTLLRRINLDAKVYITKKNTYIGFNMNDTSILLNISTMITIKGKEAEDAFIGDPLSYVFNDRYSEVF